MASISSRYTKIYSKLNRPNVAQYFPRHVFMREPNKVSNFEAGTNRIIVKQ